MRPQRWMLILMTVLLFSMAGRAQGAHAFDVISIKPSRNAEGSMWKWTESGYEAQAIPLDALIAAAYDVKVWRVSGLPPWAEAGRWDIHAKMTDTPVTATGNGDDSLRRDLLIDLLKTRFGMAAHVENRQATVLELTVVPGSNKLRRSVPLPLSEVEENRLRMASFAAGPGHMKMKYITMAVLTQNLSYQLGRDVVDRTGLTGLYDIDLTWTPEGQEHLDSADAPPSLTEALKEQLGLKLNSTKAPAAFVVVDHLSPPGEN